MRLARLRDEPGGRAGSRSGNRARGRSRERARGQLSGDAPRRRQALAVVGAAALLGAVLLAGGSASGTSQAGAASSGSRPDNTVSVRSTRASWAGELLGLSVTSASSAWAVGTSTATRGRQESLVLRYDGHSWQQMPSPSPGAVTVLSGVSGDWAVGSYGRGGSEAPSGIVTETASRSLLLHFDGRRWTVVASPDPGPMTSLSGINGSWAWGSYGASSSRQQLLVLHLAGSRWVRVPAPHPQPFQHLNDIDGSWAVGWDTDRAGHESVLVLRLDGRSWQQAAAPPRQDVAYLDAISGGWAVGGVTRGPTHLFEPVILHLVGSHWQNVAAPSPGRDTHLYTAGGDWAAGVDDGPGVLSFQPVLLHLVGGSWRAVPAPGSPEFTDVALTGVGGNWAVGYTGPIDRQSLAVTSLRTVILHWTGSRWATWSPAG